MLKREKKKKVDFKLLLAQLVLFNKSDCSTIKRALAAVYLKKKEERKELES